METLRSKQLARLVQGRAAVNSRQCDLSTYALSHNPMWSPYHDQKGWRKIKFLETHWNLKGALDFRVMWKFRCISVDWKHVHQFTWKFSVIAALDMTSSAGKHRLSLYCLNHFPVSVEGEAMKQLPILPEIQRRLCKIKRWVLKEIFVYWKRLL